MTALGEIMTFFKRFWSMKHINTVFKNLPGNNYDTFGLLSFLNLSALYLALITYWHLTINWWPLSLNFINWFTGSFTGSVTHCFNLFIYLLILVIIILMIRYEQNKLLTNHGPLEVGANSIDPQMTHKRALNCYRVGHNNGFIQNVETEVIYYPLPVAKPCKNHCKNHC